MANVVEIKFYCGDCHMEFEVKYDDDDFVRPSYCVACGSDNDLVEKED